MTFRVFVCLLGVLLSISSPARSQLANRPPAPQWLSGETLQRDFDAPKRLLMAVLLVAGDAETTITLNNKLIGRIPPSATASSLDVTRHLRAGANTLVLESTGKTAALLEVNGDLAKKTWLRTDADWPGARVLGPTDADPATDPFDLKKTHDAYNSWKLAARDSQPQATDPASIQVPPGYRVQLVHSATPEQDSWVSMAFDPAGRVVLGMEKKGLLRLSFSQPDQPEVASARVIDDTLEECRGLLFAHGWLYANANRSKTLYRLRDADDDGVFEDKEALLSTGGGYGHGRNHLKLGPDGRIWIVHGNNVHIPDRISESSPLQHYANDQLIPNPWDSGMFDGDVELPAGHILSMNPDGSDVRLFAGGLRNPLDIAFNRHGDLFTFDADMERDVGAPWYVPHPRAACRARRRLRLAARHRPLARVFRRHLAQRRRYRPLLPHRRLLRLRRPIPRAGSGRPLHLRLVLWPHHRRAFASHRQHPHRHPGKLHHRPPPQRHRWLHRTRRRALVHHWRARHAERVVSRDL